MKLRTFQMEAVTELAPSADWYIGPDQILVWRDAVVKKPDESVIQAKMAELKAEFTANSYQRDRQYPNLGEQLDMLFHDMTTDKGSKTGEWYKAIAKVKSDNPKEQE